MELQSVVKSQPSFRGICFKKYSGKLRRKTKLPYDGGERKFVRQEMEVLTLGYLVDGEEKEISSYIMRRMWHFSYVQVTVSPSTSIVLLEKSKG